MVTFEGSGQVGGITDYVFDEHRRSYAEWFQKAPIQVLCGPFGKYLRLVGVKRIDLLSIDVEGAELDVLETMDWTIPVHVIIIELVVNDDGGSVRAEKTWALLKDKGFRFRGAAPAMFSSHKVSEISAVDEVWINDAYPQ
mmetsp:Transcript_15617/g.37270  ORF Transcript_15617/g.37270 Transcript_15617/m.37270 type:complete len:140 (+) Transcript_15617:2-421(+)